MKAVAACLIPLQLIFCCAAYADATESIQSDETEKSPTKIAQSIAAKPSAQTAQVISEKSSAQSPQTISEKPSAQAAQAISEKPSALIAQGTSQKPASHKPAAQAAKAASPKPPSQIAPTTAASPAPAKPSDAQDAGSLAPLGAPITLNDVNNPDVTNGLHEADKTLQLNSLYLSRSVEMNSFDALRHETSADQIITLHDAINYVLDQGMQIKISRESMNYQHWLTLSGLASFLPSFSTSFNLTRADVTNFSTTSVGKTFLAGVNYPVFQGGGVLYSMLAQRYREKAWREAYKATVSDVFLDVYQKYINLLLQRVLLQTWAKTVEADQEQLRLNNAQLSVGTGTRYAVMQTEAQLALDRQSFLQQAVAMRQAGLALNLALNCPLSINLIPAEATLSEAGIFDDNVQLKSLITDTMKFNPGLRQYENFRLSASRNIQAQAASLYPTVSFFTLYQLNNATVNPAANGFALGGAATSAIASFLDSSFAGRVSNNALGQLYGFSPTAGSTSTQGANTGPSAMPAASGGTPLYAVQSGSLVSSGAVAPSIFGGGTGSSSGPNVNGSLQAPAGIFPGFFSEFQSGFSLSWSLPSFGLTTVANLYASKLLARQALMQCNQEISLVVSQVRSDYLAVLQARQSIDKAAATAASFREALRYAKARLDNGVGTQLDIIVAQKDYVTAVTGQAQAIVASNVAQAQLLHDMGIISAETLTTGYKPGAFLQPIPTSRRKWYQP
jgi:outer membrane protein TolC